MELGLAGRRPAGPARSPVHLVGGSALGTDPSGDPRSLRLLLTPVRPITDRQCPAGGLLVDPGIFQQQLQHGCRGCAAVSSARSIVPADPEQRLRRSGSAPQPAPPHRRLPSGARRAGCAVVVAVAVRGPVVRAPGRGRTSRRRARSQRARCAALPRRVKPGRTHTRYPSPRPCELFTPVPRPAARPGSGRRAGPRRCARRSPRSGRRSTCRGWSSPSIKVGTVDSMTTGCAIHAARIALTRSRSAGERAPGLPSADHQPLAACAVDRLEDQFPPAGRSRRPGRRAPFSRLGRQFRSTGSSPR